jgi:hypothetical protein
VTPEHVCLPASQVFYLIIIPPLLQTHLAPPPEVCDSHDHIKAQLDGAWLGPFYVITDVIDKESYSNAPCIRPEAARDWASEARWILKGTWRGQLLRLHGASSLRPKPISSKSV